MKRSERLYSAVTPIWTKEMAKRLAVSRMRKLWTQKELSYALSTPDLKITQQVIARIEKGQIKCLPLPLARISAVLGDRYMGFILFGDGGDQFPSDQIQLEYWHHKLKRKPKFR